MPSSRATDRAATSSTYRRPWRGGWMSTLCTWTALPATSMSPTTSSACWVTQGLANATLSSRPTWPPPRCNQVRKGTANDVLSPPTRAGGRRRRAAPIAPRGHGVGAMRGPGGADRTGRTAVHRRSWPAHELLPQGVHPADEAVPGCLPLLHVRARAAGRRAALPLPRSRARHRAPGPGRRLQGGPVHARRPAGAALRGRARGPAPARRGHDPPLPGAVGGAGAEGDGPAAPPQSRGDGRG